MLLYEQSIEGNEKISADALDDFYRQEANVRLPLIPWAPYVSIYYLGKKFHNPDKLRRKRERTEEKFNEKIAEADREGKDTRQARLQAKKESKIEKINRNIDEGNFLMRIGEPVTVYDSTLSAESAEQMKRFLHNKGFFNAATSYTADTSGRKVSVVYHIKEKRGYIVDSLSRRIGNKQILELLERNSKQSYLAKGKRYDQADLAAERNRISDLLRDNGYYEFSQQYVEFNVDSTIGDHKVAIQTEILRPANRSYHKQFTVDSVVFVTDATIRGDLQGRQSRQVNGITYLFFEESYSKKVLDNRVFIRPDSLYSKARTLETQKQLANLDNFKFININYDTTNGKFVSYIYSNPLKRFQTSNEAGFTYSVGIPGPFFTTTWTMRNVFGGLENMEFNLRASIEGIPSPIDPTSAFRSTQFGGNLSLIFPQFLAPFGSELRNRIGRYNPKTRWIIGANFTDRAVFRRNTFNTSLNYTWQTERQRRNDFYNRQYTFVPTDISIIRSSFSGVREENPFYIQLQEWEKAGNPYINSFTNAFVSSMYFYVVFNKNNYGTYIQKSRYIRPFIESGGTTQNLVDFRKLGFLGDATDARDGSRLATFKFLKFSNDYRKFNPIGEKTAIAWRVNAGVAVPYGKGGLDQEGNRLAPTLPYEKFFFAGGSNSIRAFRPRRLGPGVYIDTLRQIDNTYTNRIEQPGEVLLEASIEYRHNIFGFLNGAVFLDAGNVWRLRESGLPGSQFKVDQFYRQIALGTGYGFRLDFSFLIIRLDLGLKLYNPQSVKLMDNGSYDYSAGWIWDENYGSRPKGGSFWDQDPIILNIGIGYPF